MQSATSRPVIDELFKGIVFGDGGIWERLAKDRLGDLLSVRAVVSTAHHGGVDIDLGSGVTSNECVISLFEGPRAHFISLDTSVQASRQDGRSVVPLDHSLSFDSNFAERLKAVVHGRKVGDVERNRVLSVLMLKANDSSVQFDILPFLFENVRLTRSDPSNERPADTLVAFRMLDSLNWDALRNDPGNFVFETDAASLSKSLRPAAIETVAEFYRSEDIARFEARALGIQALLLRFATLWHASKDTGRILAALQDFCAYELGFMPSTELSVIWCGIRSRAPARFLGPITGHAVDLLNEIRSMAWDIAHLRLLETLSSSRVRGSFYLPYFVSFDAKWRELLCLNPIRFILFDHSRMLVGRAQEKEFQTACSEFRSEALDMSDGKVAARREAASKITKDAMANLVAQEEDRLSRARGSRG